MNFDAKGFDPDAKMLAAMYTLQKNQSAIYNIKTLTNTRYFIHIFHDYRKQKHQP